MVDQATRENLTPQEMAELEAVVRGDGPIAKVDEEEVQALIKSAEEATKGMDDDAWETTRGQIDDLEARQNLAMQLAAHEHPEPPKQLLTRDFTHGVAIIYSNDGSGAYTITEVKWNGTAWAEVGSTHGHYRLSARDISSKTDGLANEYVVFWQQLNSSGAVETLIASLSHLGIQSLTDPDADRITFWDNSAKMMKWLRAHTGLTLSGTDLTADDEKVKVDSAATAGHLGASSADGVLRTGANLTYADGGDFVTLGLGDPNAGATLDDLTNGEGAGTWTAASSANGVQFIAVTDLDRAAGAINGWWYRTFKLDEKGRCFSISGATYISS